MSHFASKDELLAFQRKEKKDLFSKTQKMKHGISKGDKKKKKEVTAEITRLVALLDSKHENEIKEFEENEEAVKKSELLEDVKKCNEDIALEKHMQNLSFVDDSVEDTGSVIGVDKVCKVSQAQRRQEKHEEKIKKSELLENAEKGDGDIAFEKHIQKHSLANDSVEDKESVNGGVKVHRVSKAQRRRNKKALLEKERNKAIAEQELEDFNNLRHTEYEGIMRKLSERNLIIHEVPSDGNCLYKAIEHQLSSLGLQETTVQSLRENTSKYMLSHMNEYLPFLTHPETGDVLTEEQYLKYCEDIAETSSWGGHIEVQVLSLICEYPIEIIQFEGPSIICGNESRITRLILSYHRHAYGLGEHYNSVIPLE